MFDFSEVAKPWAINFLQMFDFSEVVGKLERGYRLLLRLTDPIKQLFPANFNLKFLTEL